MSDGQGPCQGQSGCGGGCGSNRAHPDNTPGGPNGWPGFDMFEAPVDEAFVSFEESLPGALEGGLPFPAVLLVGIPGPEGFGDPLEEAFGAPGALGFGSQISQALERQAGSPWRPRERSEGPDVQASEAPRPEARQELGARPFGEPLAVGGQIPEAPDWPDTGAQPYGGSLQAVAGALAGVERAMGALELRMEDAHGALLRGLDEQRARVQQLEGRMAAVEAKLDAALDGRAGAGPSRAPAHDAACAFTVAPFAGHFSISAEGLSGVCSPAGAAGGAPKVVTINAPEDTAEDSRLDSETKPRPWPEKAGSGTSFGKPKTRTPSMTTIKLEEVPSNVLEAAQDFVDEIEAAAQENPLIKTRSSVKKHDCFHDSVKDDPLTEKKGSARTSFS